MDNTDFIFCFFTPPLASSKPRATASGSDLGQPLIETFLSKSKRITHRASLFIYLVNPRNYRWRHESFHPGMARFL
jgi:hypothetical protein